jgi:hypothetical protein
MNGEGCGRKRSWPNLSYYLGISGVVDSEELLAIRPALSV